MALIKHLYDLKSIKDFKDDTSQLIAVQDAGSPGLVLSQQLK